MEARRSSRLADRPVEGRSGEGARRLCSYPKCSHPLSLDCNDGLVEGEERVKTKGMVCVLQARGGAGIHVRDASGQLVVCVLPLTYFGSVLDVILVRLMWGRG